MAASNDTLTFYFRFEAEPRLQTTVRQLGLESSIRHTQGWLKLNCVTYKAKINESLQEAPLHESLHTYKTCTLKLSIFVHCLHH